MDAFQICLLFLSQKGEELLTYCVPEPWSTSISSLNSTEIARVMHYRFYLPALRAPMSMPCPALSLCHRRKEAMDVVLLLCLPERPTCAGACFSCVQSQSFRSPKDHSDTDDQELGAFLVLYCRLQSLPTSSAAGFYKQILGRTILQTFSASHEKKNGLLVSEATIYAFGWNCSNYYFS